MSLSELGATGELVGSIGVQESWGRSLDQSLELAVCSSYLL